MFVQSWSVAGGAFFAIVEKRFWSWNVAAGVFVVSEAQRYVPTPVT